uniref:CSab-Lyc-11 n=1 Tax=Lychas buchari TaxID=1330406 RepID=T1DPB7_9SCOR
MKDHCRIILILLVLSVATEFFPNSKVDAFRCYHPKCVSDCVAQGFASGQCNYKKCRCTTKK